MPPINSLSRELLDLILSYVPRNDDRPGPPLPSPSLLPLYAIVCKDWTNHFERRAFKSLKIKSTDLDQARRIVQGRRAAAVCRIEYEVVLPAYSDHACASFETHKDRDQNDLVFSEAIHGLFKLLKSWETGYEYDQSLGAQDQPDHSVFRAHPRAFEIFLADVYSPMDTWRRGSEKWTEDHMQWELGGRHDIFEKRWENSFLRLIGMEDLAYLTWPIQFTSNTSTRNITPASLAGIACKFANTNSIVLDCRDSELKFPSLRQRLRYDFARVIDRLPAQSLVSFNLNYHHELPNENFVPITALHHSSPSTDHLSLALHRLSQAPNLKTITLGGGIIISPALFWPSDSSTDTPHWPNLQKISVSFNTCTPTCGWYFIRHPSKVVDDDGNDTENEERRARQIESENDSDPNVSSDSETRDSYHPLNQRRTRRIIPHRRFRNWPNEKEILPLLEAAAKAAKCMPKLEMMTLAVSGESWEVFKMTFLARGVVDFRDEDPENDIRKARLYFRVREWRLSEEVSDCWKDAVSQGDQGLLIRYYQ